MDKNNQVVEREESKKEERRAKQREFNMRVNIIAILLMILLLCLSQCHGNPTEEAVSTAEKITFDLSEDGNATEGKIAKDTSIVDRLNAQVEDSMVNISMNSNPIFVDGVGNVLITNSDTNRNPQVIEIYYGEEKIYQSGIIPVGSNVASAELDTELPEGDYDCTA